MALDATLSPAQLDNLRDDPQGFIEYILGQWLWTKQIQIAESVRDNRRTAVPSCHGAGKTNLAGRLVLWWLFTHPESQVVTTAPTMRQVVTQVWKELRSAYAKARIPLGGDLLPKAPRMELAGNPDWMAIGYSTDADSSFHGVHSVGGNLLILDEASGIDPLLYNAVRGCMTSPKDRLLMLGNPTNPSGPFYDMCRRPDVNTIHISAFDVPNVIENREVIPGLASREWVDEMQSDCGPSYDSHPDYIARVLGRFPDVDDNVLVPLSWYDHSERLWTARNAAGDWDGRCVLGVDVARLGANRTCIADTIVGAGTRRLYREPKQSTMATTGRVLDLGRELDAKELRVDVDGIGSGVCDRLTELGHPVVEMGGGRKSLAVGPDGEPRYSNQRAEWYWTLRQRLDKDLGDAALALPPDPRLRAQLTAIRWSTTSRGLKQIESKDAMEKRGMKSPDEADAVAYGHAMPYEDFDVIGHLTAMTR